jgi:hypothetical protein
MHRGLEGAWHRIWDEVLECRRTAQPVEERVHRISWARKTRVKRPGRMPVPCPAPSRHIAGMGHVIYLIVTVPLLVALSRTALP